MVVKTKILHSIVAVAALGISACGKGPIDSIKSSYIDGARTTTVENALTQRAVCKSEKWKSFKDDRGRTVVEYRCDIVDGDDFLREKREQHVSYLTKDTQSSLQREVDNYEKVKTRLEDDFPDVKARIEYLKEKIAERKAMPTAGLTEREKLLRANIGNLEFELKMNEERLMEGRRSAASQMESAQRWIKEAQARSEDSAIKNKALKEYPVYKDTHEIFQWIVNQEGDAALIYGEIEAVQENGEKAQLLKYNKPDSVLTVISRSKATKFIAYLAEIQTHSAMHMFSR